MATVTDYASLKQAILDFTHRDSLSSYADYFIQDGEDRIYRKVLELNEGRGLRWMEAALSLTINGTTGYATVPTDYLALKAAQVSTGTGQYDLVQKEPQYIYEHYPVRSAQGIPSYIAREASNFIFGPFPDSGYTILGTYYQRATALSASNTTTWMTTNIPMTLHAACMGAACKFLKDAQGAQLWLAEMADRLASICLTDKAADFGSSPLVIGSATPAPGGW